MRVTRLQPGGAWVCWREALPPRLFACASSDRSPAPDPWARRPNGHLPSGQTGVTFPNPPRWDYFNYIMNTTDPTIPTGGSIQSMVRGLQARAPAAARGRHCAPVSGSP